VATASAVHVRRPQPHLSLAAGRHVADVVQAVRRCGAAEAAVGMQVRELPPVGGRFFVDGPCQDVAVPALRFFPIEMMSASSSVTAAGSPTARHTRCRQTVSGSGITRER